MSSISWKQRALFFLMIVIFTPVFAYSKNIIYPGPNANNKEVFNSCVVKEGYLYFQSQKFQLIKNKGQKDEDLHGYEYPSPDKKSILIMVNGPGNDDGLNIWDLWLYIPDKKQKTELTEDLPKNVYVGWLNNEMYYFYTQDEAGDDTVISSINQINKFYNYLQLIAVDLTDHLYLSLDQDSNDFSVYLKVGKLFSEEIAQKKKINIKDADFLKDNIKSSIFLSDKVNVKYVNDSGGIENIFLEYPKGLNSKN